ncbi:Flagellar basal-body rod protein FlgG [hydrothermal vent metagenome]|uniref:Flagellar basal-body rod protein FlgG n=1 Tax=hydrothermal vent metagenome TaxID=652676 RepID=A0A1W1CLM1_9ZZZZ
MQTGYYSSAAGMVTQFNRLNTIANNLANVNTNGYKEDNLIVGDFMRLYQEKRDTLPNENNTKEAAKFINRTMARVPQIVDDYTDFSLGNLQKTDNQLDVALSHDNLFFAVKTPQGIRLTRDGSFSLDDEGKLVTKEGYEVLGDDYFNSKDGISFATTESVINIDKNGQILTNVPGSVKLTQNKKLLIASVDNLRYLKKEGDNLYKLNDMKRLKISEESGAVRQGFVEKSNVNAVKMMTQLIETNRLVGMYQKAMDTQMNEMNKDAIEKIARKA